MKKRIVLQGLRVPVSIGIHGFEKAAPQPYRVDIELTLISSYRCVLDEISETVDYDALHSRVLDFLGGRHFNLQETVIQTIMDLCFDLDPRVEAASVRCSKTQVYPDCDSVGLAYEALRSSWAVDKNPIIP